jgi:hypothetical protein
MPRVEREWGAFAVWLGGRDSNPDNVGDNERPCDTRKPVRMACRRFLSAGAPCDTRSRLESAEWADTAPCRTAPGRSL